MRAARIHQFGTPDVLHIEEIDTPAPAEGQVCVQVKAAGVGPWDGWVRAGQSVIEQPLPLTPGSDIAGVVSAVGRGVTAFAVGDEVFGVTNPAFTGGYAEYALASASMLAHKPAELSFAEGAAAPVVTVTALQMLFDHGKLSRGQRVLVHGAAGSVGACAVQFALEAGAHVIGTHTPRDAEYARTLGAHELIDTTHERFEERLEPVDLVIDTVGGELQERSFAVLERGGALISAVAKPDQERAAARGVRAEFILVDVTTAALERVALSLRSGRLKLRVGAQMPLAEARATHEMLEGTRARPAGKIVLLVGDL